MKLKNNFEKLLEGGLLDEETSKALKEAINTKVEERLEEEKEKLREEFVQRYEHDKKVMVEAADKMFNENFDKEIKSLVGERAALTESKVAYKRMIKENAIAIHKFIATKLHEEIAEFRKDRKDMAEGMLMFEKFAVKKLGEEIAEFQTDKKELVETKVKLIKEAKSKIEESKKEFVRRAAKIVETNIETAMRKEIGDFRKDIKESRKNFFGRRLFEAFQAEFMASHASDGTKVKDLFGALKERDTKLAEANRKLVAQKDLLESATTKKKLAESKLQRHKKLSELLTPLPRDQKQLMGELLDKVPTMKLDESYKKHLKYVLDGTSNKSSVLAESVTKKHLSSSTGNKRIVESKDVDETTAFTQEEEKRLQVLCGIKN